ncbi:MAG TPA: ABC transporter permease [Bordetella sp.]
MLKYIVKRILATIPVLCVVGVFIFSLLFVAPGDPAAILAGDQATQQDLQRIRQEMGLDRPFAVQFMDWAGHMLRGDMGHSVFNKQPVAHLIGSSLEPTLLLMVMTIVLAVAVGVPMGVVAAFRHGGRLDTLVMSMSVLGFSVPVFVIGYILAYVFALRLGWLPVQGYVPLSESVWQAVRSLILPAFTLSGMYVALIARTSRAAMLEVLQQDYIRTARAKGVSMRDILFVHALRNCGVSILTVVGVGIALLIGGAVVTESVFAIPGLGRLVVDAILQRDYPVIQGVVVFFSLLYVMVNLIIDLLYTLVDPRIRY